MSKKPLPPGCLEAAEQHYYGDMPKEQYDKRFKIETSSFVFGWKACIDYINGLQEEIGKPKLLVAPDKVLSLVPGPQGVSDENI